MKPFIKHIYGDKDKKLEPEHHEFKFPGGSVNIQRTSNNEYWVHLMVIEDAMPEIETHMEQKAGKIVDSRIDLTHEEYLKHGIPSVIHAENAQHIAFRVATE